MNSVRCQPRMGEVFFLLGITQYTLLLLTYEVKFESASSCYYSPSFFATKDWKFFYRNRVT
jgi:hypothetical protein